jgi:hypothetical protein
MRQRQDERRYGQEVHASPPGRADPLSDPWVTSTMTVAYIAITPNAVAAGRYEAAPGMKISAAPNGMNGSTRSPPTWMPSNSRPHMEKS